VQAIDDAREGRTTIVISHRPTTVEHADRTLSMRGGVIISDQERSSVATAGSA
jgi:ABC-type multidrug transport system fused ATPase/permease subunit